MYYRLIWSRSNFAANIFLTTSRMYYKPAHYLSHKP
jgi:hypothetical protein